MKLDDFWGTGGGFGGFIGILIETHRIKRSLGGCPPDDPPLETFWWHELMFIQYQMYIGDEMGSTVASGSGRWYHEASDKFYSDRVSPSAVLKLLRLDWRRGPAIITGDRGGTLEVDTGTNFWTDAPEWSNRIWFQRPDETSPLRQVFREWECCPNEPPACEKTCQPIP
jgi:hypothetical protein